MEGCVEQDKEDKDAGRRNERLCGGRKMRNRARTTSEGWVLCNGTEALMVMWC